MALVFADRVKDSSTTTGTGTFTISGTAATGYQTFNSGIGVGNTCYYCIAGQAGSTDPTEWEVGLGTLASATTITRSSGNVLSSSSGAGTLVTFSAGVKDVFVTSPALWATSPSFTGNVGTAQLSVGTTDTTTAYAYIAPTQSTLQHQFAVAGTNTFNNATIQGLNLVPTLTGGALTTTMYGVISNPKFTGVTGTVTGVIGVQSNPQYNSSGSITNFSALITNIAIGTSGTGAITNAYSNRAQAPTISAAAAITNFYQYFAAEAAPSSGTITTAYSYYGSQTTASGATNNWNLYMTGNAPNYLAGQLSIGSTLTNVAPVYFNLSTTLQNNFQIQGTNTFATASGTPSGMYLSPTMTGVASSTSMVGLNAIPLFAPVAASTHTAYYAVQASCVLNNANAPATISLFGIRSYYSLVSAVSTSTIAAAYAVVADSPSISSAATVTNSYGFFAANQTKGSGTITNAYAYYGNQGTGSATNSWNLYMAGAAPNYLAGQLSIGTTTTTSAYILAAPTTSLQYGFSLLGTNTNVAPSAMLINTTLSGTTGSSALIGLNVIPIFSPLVAVGNAWATTSTAYLNSSFAPSNAMAYRGVIQLSATSLTGTIAGAYTFYANAPTIDASATTAITQFSQFYATNVAGTAGSAIGTAYAFFGAQASSNTGVTANWNLYMNGSAPNYLAGQLCIGSTTLTSSTSGFLNLTGTQSTVENQMYIGGTNSTAQTTLTGIRLNPTYSGSTTTYVYGINNIVNYNANALTNFYGYSMQLRVNATALGGSTIGTMIAYEATQPFVDPSSTTTISNSYQFYAANIVKGSAQTTTNAYAFYGNQATGSATNSWNLYAAGNAPNYLAGALNVGSTTLTNAPVYFASSTTLQYNFMMQGTNTYATASGTPIGMYINPNINGIASSVSMVGLSVVPIFGPVTSAVVSSLYGIIGNSYLNTANAPVTVTLAGIRGLFTLASAVSTRAVANGYAFLADTPSISSTSTITTVAGFYAQNITKGSGTITNAYAFYGNQGTGSATNSWNFYAAGAAPNYLAGQLNVGDSTSLTGGYVYITKNTTLPNIFLLGGNTTNAIPVAISLQPQITGTTATSDPIGLYSYNTFQLSSTGAVPTVTGFTTTAKVDAASATSMTSLYGVSSAFDIGGNQTVTLANAYAYYTKSTIGAVAFANITNAFGYYAGNISSGANQNISNVYAFYGNQTTSSGYWNLYMAGSAPNYLNSNLLIGTTTVPSTSGNLVQSGLHATSAAAPTVASGTTIAVTTQIAFISGTTAIATITAPNPISAGGGQITLIPTGAFTTTTAGNIALASTAVVSKALIMTYDTTTAKWYPSY